MCYIARTNESWNESFEHMFSLAFEQMLSHLSTYSHLMTHFYARNITHLSKCSQMCYVNESWDESCHAWMSHCTDKSVKSHMNESYHTWMNMSRMNESCHLSIKQSALKRVMLRERMSQRGHVAHNNDSERCIASHEHWAKYSQTPHVNESSHKWMSHVTHEWVISPEHWAKCSQTPPPAPARAPQVPTPHTPRGKSWSQVSLDVTLSH